MLLVLVSLMFAILYWASPNAKTGGFRWVSPGGIFAVVLWLLASVALRDLPGQLRQLQQDVRHARRCHRLPGLDVDRNIAILLGAELDAELERGRAIAAGHDPTDEPFLELRDDRKIKKGSEQGLSQG